MDKVLKRDLYLFFDYDGTLFTDGLVSEDSKIAINKAKELGAKIFLNTGRARGNILPDVFKELKGVTFDGVLSAGACIYDGNGVDNPILEKVLTEQETRALVKYACDKSYWFTVENLEDMITGELHGEITYTKEYRDDYCLKILEKLKGKRSVKISFFPPVGILDREIPEIFPQYDWVTYTRCIELFHKGLNKGSLMDKLRKIKNIENGFFVAFGDSLNDVDMFKHADYSIAMKKSPDGLKKYADYVCESENGVFEGIYKILESVF